MSPRKHKNSSGVIIICVPVGGLKTDPNVATPMGIILHSSLESVNETSPAPPGAPSPPEDPPRPP